jgi:murein DD-endopeptidase MepM/ murein hydrolase activator NlpD
MANKMVANIKSLSTETRGLTKEVESLYKSIEKLNAVAGKAFTNVNNAISTSGGSMALGQGTTRPGVGTDGAKFTQPPAPTGMSPAAGTTQVSKSKTEFAQEGPEDPTVSKLKTFGGIAKIAMAIPAGAYAATPDVGLTMGRALGYYQAGLTAPGISRNQLQRATFGAMGGGLSSVGSDAIVAAGLAGRGYTPGSANYQQAAAQIGGAYKYLGMDNAVATQAISGFQTGPMGANLYQYGITTRTEDGKEKTPGQIAKELMNVMGGGKATTEQVRQSYQRGALGANLKTMGFDAAQQEILYQAMIDISAGKNPDLAKRGSEQGTDKNSNTMLTAQGRMNASQTSLMTKGEESMIKGFENAADTVEAFNRALENVIPTLAQIKGLVGGVGATNVGAGLATTAALLTSGVSDLGSLLGILKNILGKGKGGGATGYGAGFGMGGATGSPPIASGVTAAYGEKGSMWAGTNGTHKGTDYAVPIGTPVTSWKEGVVSNETLDSGYGTAIMIEHADGYQSIYAHLSSKEVKAGDSIKAGQRIGKSGDTGNVTGPHLHFELRDGKNNPVDPNNSTSVSSFLGMEYASAVVSPSASDILNTNTASKSKNSSVGTTMSINGPVGKGALSNSELLSVLSGAGFSGSSLETAFRVVRAESGGRPGALNPNEKTGDYSLGLFQVNMIGNLGKKRNENYLKTYGDIGYTGPESLYDPAINARIAYDISKSGTKWTDAWVNTSKKLGIKGGGDVGYGASMPTQLQSSTPKDFVGYKELMSFEPKKNQDFVGYKELALTQPQSGNKTVNVTIKFDQATDQNAIIFAKKVKEYLDHDKEISMIGGS